MKIYLASSARNPRFDVTKALLERHGHQVFDWKTGFTYGDKLPDPDCAPVGLMHEWLRDPATLRQLSHDLAGIAQADALVVLLPCGNDAHTEMGIAIAMQIPTFVLAPDGAMRAGLFYGLARGLFADTEALAFQLDHMERADGHGTIA